jgi:hypothetical protein
MDALPLGYLNVIGLQILLERTVERQFPFISNCLHKFFVLKAVVSSDKMAEIGTKKLLHCLLLFHHSFLSGIAILFYYKCGNDKS